MLLGRGLKITLCGFCLGVYSLEGEIDTQTGHLNIIVLDKYSGRSIQSILGNRVLTLTGKVRRAMPEPSLQT